MSPHSTKSTDAPLGSGDAGKPRGDFLVEQWKAYVELYKHSADMFFKSVLLYLGIVSVAAGLIFKEVAAGAERRLLAIFICVASAQMLLGCRAALSWARSLSQRLADVEADLKAHARFPVTELSRFVLLAMIGVSIILVAGLVQVWYVFHLAG